MREDDRKVVLLGRDLLSYLPQARQSSDTIRAKPGLAESRYVPCETCGARGRVAGPKGEPCAGCVVRIAGVGGVPPLGNPIHGCRPCLVCDGTGWRRARRKEIEESPWDEAVGVPVRSETQDVERKRWEEMADLERRLEHTKRLLALWEGLDTYDVAWEEVRQAVWRSGSYANLARAMAAQADVTPRRVSVFWHVIVLSEPVRLAPGSAVELMRTTRMLADRMPKPIRVPRHLLEAELARKDSAWRGRTKRHAQQRADRDASIRYERDVLGWSAKKIAARHHLTTHRVNQILRAVASAPA